MPAHVDDTAHRPHERLTAGSVGEGGVATPQLTHQRRPDVETAEEPSDLGRGTDQRFREAERHHVLDTGQRQRPEGPRHLAPEPAAAHQHETVDQLGMLVGELHGNAATVRVADDRGARHLEQREEVAQSAGERTGRVVAERFGRLAVTEKIGRDHIVIDGEARHHRIPRPGVPAQPVNEENHLAGPASLAPGELAGAAVPNVVAVEGHVLQRRWSGHDFSMAEPGSSGWRWRLGCPVEWNRRRGSGPGADRCGSARAQQTARTYGYGLTATPPPGCTSKWRWFAVVLPVWPT